MREQQRQAFGVEIFARAYLCVSSKGKPSDIRPRLYMCEQ